MDRCNYIVPHSSKIVEMTSNWSQYQQTIASHRISHLGTTLNQDADGGTHRHCQTHQSAPDHHCAMYHHPCFVSPVLGKVTCSFLLNFYPRDYLRTDLLPIPLCHVSSTWSAPSTRRHLAHLDTSILSSYRIWVLGANAQQEFLVDGEEHCDIGNGSEAVTVKCWKLSPGIVE